MSQASVIVFIIIFVIVFVIVFVIICVIVFVLFLSLFLSLFMSLSLSFFLVRACLLITLIKCLKGHKSLGLLFEHALKMSFSSSLSLSLYLYFSLSFFGQVMSPHHSDQMSQRSQVSRIALWWCSLNVFVFVISLSLYLSLSQVSRIALWRCSLNVFVFVIVFVFVYVFVIVFFLVRSCLLITLIKCLKGQKSLGLLFEGDL